MIPKGIKATELIEKLQKLIERYGDREVFAGGGDYPSGVRGVWVKDEGMDPYLPRGGFHIT